ncbi:hypothetical protein D7Y09_13990 [bacterium 1XD42-1]|nr:hypothetical protein D7X25_14330 [bacterium 1XD42-8]RKJ62311.1 hypothetical protein D7Y09_13990 [bacterium 1XD42-1]
MLRKRALWYRQSQKKTGITGGVLYKSIHENPTRKLRADEFMKICAFLDVDPRQFWRNETNNTAHNT